MSWSGWVQGTDEKIPGKWVRRKGNPLIQLIPLEDALGEERKAGEKNRNAEGSAHLKAGPDSAGGIAERCR